MKKDTSLPQSRFQKDNEPIKREQTIRSFEQDLRSLTLVTKYLNSQECQSFFQKKYKDILLDLLQKMKLLLIQQGIKGNKLSLAYQKPPPKQNIPIHIVQNNQIIKSVKLPRIQEGQIKKKGLTNENLWKSTVVHNKEQFSSEKEENILSKSTCHRIRLKRSETIKKLIVSEIEGVKLTEMPAKDVIERLKSQIINKNEMIKKLEGLNKNLNKQKQEIALKSKKQHTGKRDLNYFKWEDIQIRQKGIQSGNNGSIAENEKENRNGMMLMLIAQQKQIESLAQDLIEKDREIQRLNGKRMNRSADRGKC